MIRTACLGIFVALASGSLANAQCPAWDPGFTYQPGLNDVVRATLVFDDGTGPALYAAGTFTSAGSTAIAHVAKWSGTSWLSLGSGLSYPGTTARAYAMAAYDDGSGPALYVGGTFTVAGGAAISSIAKWNGSSWSPLGSGMVSSTGAPGSVYSLLAFDDGTGPALYAGGAFQVAGGVTVNGIAKWDGASWSALASGMRGLGANSTVYVYALAEYDDGGGPALFAGGSFLTAGGSLCYSIAKWDGASWQQLGNGTNGIVDSLVVHDDGTGPALYASGTFTTAGSAPASHIARWNGAAWSSLGSGAGPASNTLRVFDDGSGAKLYAGGSFTTIGGTSANHIARWDGTSWSPLASGVNDAVWSLIVFDDGFGAGLVAGGAFTAAGSVVAERVAKWNGSTWAPVGTIATTGGLNDTVHALQTVDIGSGPALYAGGDFTSAGTMTANGIARRNGVTWDVLGAGVAHVQTIVGFDAGSGTAVYVGASAGCWRWTGSTWQLLGTGMDGPVYAMAVFGDGGPLLLYAGGNYHTASGTIVNAIARWNGTQWLPVASGVSGTVLSMAVFDDGTGSALYVGGTFTTASGVTVNYLGRWRGSQWSSVGGGMNSHVYALQAFDDGTGPALYAAGAFSTAGGNAANRIAKWNGSAWSAVGGGFNGLVTTLAGHDDGSGNALYAGGYFTVADASLAQHLARWNGSSWSPVGGGLDNTVYALADVTSAAGVHDLYVGGSFASAGGVMSSNIARWDSCGPAGTPLCFGDGTSGRCPCANNGAPGHGCQNSASTGGAQLATTGSTTPDTVVLHATGEIGSALSIFLQGKNALSTGVAFGDGLRCATGTLVRLYSKNASSGAVSAPSPGDPSITTRSAALGDPIAPGDRRYYQVYYRDPVTSFCPPPAGDNFNVTHAVKIVW
jgi:hypothetical protein